MATNGQDQQKRSPADWLLFFVAFGVFGLIGYLITPVVLYAEKPQPFKFSHELHMKQVDKKCKTCHDLREDGSFAGIPAMSVCTDCHSEKTLGKTPEEKIFVEQYLIPGKPIPWRVYSRQPECVFFSHAAHLKIAELDCAECHGDHGKSKNLRPYEQNRLSGYSRDIWGWDIIPFFSKPPKSMKMDDCAKCHRQSGVRDACFVCHK